MHVWPKSLKARILIKGENAYVLVFSTPLNSPVEEGRK